MNMRIIGVMSFMLLVTATAPGGTVTYTDESSFLAATGPLLFEGFENTDPGFTGSSRFLDHFGVGFCENPGPLEILDDPTVAAEGDQSLGGAVLEICFFAFDVPVDSFGFTIFGFGDEEGDDELHLQLGDSSGIFADFTLALAGDSSEDFRFFGVMADRPFTTVHIVKGNESDFIAVDRVHFGVAIPLPPALWLGMALIAGGAAVQRVRGHGRSRG